MSAGRVLDRERLVKLLGMTGSVHDGEALNAMRLANTELLKAGATWETLLAHPEAGRREPDGPRAEAWAPPPPPPPPPPRADSEWRGSSSSSSARSAEPDDPDPRPPLSRGRLLAARIRSKLKTVPLVVRVAFLPFWFAAWAIAEWVEDADEAVGDAPLSIAVHTVMSLAAFAILLAGWVFVPVRLLGSILGVL